MQILAMVFGLGSLVCWIMTLIKIFPDKEKNGILHGIIGIICGLWAFIWGWMNTGRYNNKNIMLIWTVCLIGSIVMNFLAAGQAMGG